MAQSKHLKQETSRVAEKLFHLQEQFAKKHKASTSLPPPSSSVFGATFSFVQTFWCVVVRCGVVWCGVVCTGSQALAAIEAERAALLRMKEKDNKKIEENEAVVAQKKAEVSQNLLCLLFSLVFANL